MLDKRTFTLTWCGLVRLPSFTPGCIHIASEQELVSLFIGKHKYTILLHKKSHARANFVGNSASHMHVRLKFYTYSILHRPDTENPILNLLASGNKFSITCRRSILFFDSFFDIGTTVCLLKLP